MSVIPFILNGSNRTIVENRQDYENAGGLGGEVIFIIGFDGQQLLEPNSSNASYDLRIGEEYRDHRDLGKTALSNNDKIVLQPGSAVIIETAELVQLPKSRFGQIVPKVSLLQEGLSNTSSKIDPGYNGKLLITVFNLGKRKVSLKKGDKFCTLYVLDIKAGATPYNKPPKQIIGDSKRGLFSKIQDYIETNQAYFTIILIPLTILLTIAQLVQIFK